MVKHIDHKRIFEPDNYGSQGLTVLHQGAAFLFEWLFKCA